MGATAMATRRVDALPEHVRSLEHVARRLRATCVRMAHDGHEGHLSSALSCIDLLVALYSGWLRYDPSDHAHPLRDRLLFSKGHAATALYAVSAHAGLVPPASLAQYGRSGSPFPSHPCRKMLPQLEMSSGSLGHGLGMGTGIAYSLATRNIDANVVVLMSDGECNEGTVWEAAAFACAHEQERLVAIVDNNNMQAVGRTDKLLGFTSFEEKFRAFGWDAVTIDGHDIRQILETLAQVPFSPRRPSAIIARTRGGRGVSFMEDDTLWHYRVPSAEDVERALAELGAEPLY